MKFRTVAMGALVLALAGGGSLAALHLLEGKTERAVKDALARGGASVERVDYSLWNKTLVLEKVTGTFSGEAMAVAGSLDRVEMEGVNPASLDPEAADLPGVADVVRVNGVFFRADMPGMSVETRMDGLRAEGWRQNVGRLLSLHEQQPGSEAFWTEALRYHFDMLACRGYHVIVAGDELPGLVRMDIDTAGLLGQTRLDDDGVASFSLFANGMKSVIEGAATTVVRRQELYDVTPPAPAVMTRLWPLLTEVHTSENPLSNTPLAETCLSLLREAYTGKSPYSRMVLQDYVITPEKDDAAEIRLGELEHTLSLGEPFRLGLRVTDARWDVANMTPDLADLMQPLMPDVLEQGVNVSGAFDIALGSGPSSLSWALGAPGIGHAQGRLSAILERENLDSLMEPEGILMALMRLKATSAEASYVDEGGLVLLTAALAREEGSSLLEMHETLKAHFRQEQGSAAEPLSSGQKLARACLTMLEQPGALRASFNFDPPLPLFNVMFDASSLLGYEGEHIVISAEPGSRPFADQVPDVWK